MYKLCVYVCYLVSGVCLHSGIKVVQPEVWNERGQDDGQGGGEAFEDVVGVLNDRRNNQTAKSLHTMQKNTLRWNTVYAFISPKYTHKNSRAYRHAPTNTLT